MGTTPEPEAVAPDAAPEQPGMEVQFEDVIGNLAQQIAQLTVDLAIARAQISALQAAKT